MATVTLLIFTLLILISRFVLNSCCVHLIFIIKSSVCLAFIEGAEQMKAFVY